MDSFQKTVLGISLFLLIVILIVIVIMMRATNSKKIFPPSQLSCPDGWISDASGNCFFTGKNGGKAVLPNGNFNQSTAKNISSEFPVYALTKSGEVFKNSDGKMSFSNVPLDKSVTNTVVFNAKDSMWASKGGQAICAQQKFANQYSIYWDGISNTNQCSSSSSS